MAIQQPNAAAKKTSMPPNRISVACAIWMCRLEELNWRTTVQRWNLICQAGISMYKRDGGCMDKLLGYTRAACAKIHCGCR
jgi:hypothetical protein